MPARLVVTWREGYPNQRGDSSIAGASGKGGGGGTHSRGVPWPPKLGSMLLKASHGAAAPAPDAIPPKDSVMTLRIGALGAAAAGAPPPLAMPALSPAARVEGKDGDAASDAATAANAAATAANAAATAANAAATAADMLTCSALDALLPRLPATQPQVTRLIIAADFGRPASAGGHTVSGGVGRAAANQAAFEGFW